MSRAQTKAIDAINEHGVLLVFPILNKKEPHSLWQDFHPRTPMRWEWDESGDDKVMRMWALMKQLSENTSVVYSKWYQGRATFFSRELFTAMLTLLKTPKNPTIYSHLQRSARDILEILESDSPLSTKQIKKLADLQGKDNEAQYSRAMKQLFEMQLIVAFGEVEDGAFPSLAVGATRLLYEDLWERSKKMPQESAQKTLEKFAPKTSKTRTFFEKLVKKHAFSDNDKNPLDF